MERVSIAVAGKGLQGAQEGAGSAAGEQELLALKWEDVDLVAGRIVVRRSLWQHQEGTPKSGRNREVPLSDDAVAGCRRTDTCAAPGSSASRRGSASTTTG